MLIWVTGHCNQAAVSRNRYGVEKTVDTHKILINAIKLYPSFKGHLIRSEFRFIERLNKLLFLSRESTFTKGHLTRSEIRCFEIVKYY
jgi:hypothetical protein